MMNTTFSRMTAALEQINKKGSRSAWGRGVAEYTFELVENIYYAEADPENLQELTAFMLNGAEDWTQYSYGGCSLIYDNDIAKRLCNPTELKRTHGGDRRPNACEDWLDVQARALAQAARRVRNAYRAVM